jgi:hypothetical protein
LLQFVVEPIGSDPIYKTMPTINPATEPNMQANAVLKFLADSRRYLGSWGNTD